MLFIGLTRMGIVAVLTTRSTLNNPRARLCCKATRRASKNPAVWRKTGCSKNTKSVLNQRAQLKCSSSVPAPLLWLSVWLFWLFLRKILWWKIPWARGRKWLVRPGGAIASRGFWGNGRKTRSNFRRKVRDVWYRKSRRRWTTQSTSILYLMSKMYSRSSGSSLQQHRTCV